MQSVDTTYEYVHIVCEIKLHPTEDREKVEEILYKFMSGEIEVDERHDGMYLLIKDEGTNALQLFHEWVATQRIIDTVRARLFKSIAGNVTAVYFNRQAAYMNHLSLIDVDDNIPLGPVAYQIISDNLEAIINIVTPKTYEGRLMTEKELADHLARIERKKEMKRKQKEREQNRDSKFIDENL